MKRSLIVVFLLCSIAAFTQQPIDLAKVGGAATVTGNGTASGAMRVTIASDNTPFSVNATLAAETTKVIGTVRLLGNTGSTLDFAGQNATSPSNSILIGAQFNTTPSTITSGNTSPLQLDSAGKLLVNCSSCGGGGTTSLIPATSGGLSMAHLLLAASNNATSLKGTSGQLYGASVYNNAGYPWYLKFYNKATSPSPASDTVVFSIPVQAGTQREFHTDEGLAFATGIAYAVVKGITDTDNTSVAASDGLVDLIYK